MHIFLYVMVVFTKIVSLTANASGNVRAYYKSVGYDNS